MNIDEMKDRIARAEEIQRYTENRCEALEKENADLERKLEQTEKDLADYQFNYSTIKELEKENAGLKARLNAINLLTPELEKKSKLRRQQLTKAKVCLEQLVSEITVGELEVDPNVLQQAENFLKEE